WLWRSTGISRIAAPSRPRARRGGEESEAIAGFCGVVGSRGLPGRGEVTGGGPALCAKP
ncbi:MAG: hypothetical protein AVDCRST_MAG05-3077, partial [uncultured Rubrobacteraceae bacterium]